MFLFKIRLKTQKIVTIEGLKCFECYVPHVQEGLYQRI